MTATYSFSFELSEVSKAIFNSAITGTANNVDNCSRFPVGDQDARVISEAVDEISRLVVRVRDGSLRSRFQAVESVHVIDGAVYIKLSADFTRLLANGVIVG